MPVFSAFTRAHGFLIRYGLRVTVDLDKPDGFVCIAKYIVEHNNHHHRLAVVAGITSLFVSFRSTIPYFFLH